MPHVLHSYSFIAFYPINNTRAGNILFFISGGSKNVFINLMNFKK